VAGRFRAALLQNHGAVVAHRTLAEAVDAGVELKETARLAMTLRGRGSTLDQQAIAELVERFDAIW
jgi:ribulose-5-phosphate 4-epimerase/fuculose-1-phosphate aldolase